MAIWMSYSSATVRLVSMTARVVPQSSWSFRPQAPASICSTSGLARLPLPLPRMPTLIGSPSNAWSIRMMFHAPGVQVVAQVPVAEPVPPPISVVTPLARATSICCGQMKWMWVSMPPAVTILPSPAMISVPGPITIRGSTPLCVSGLPDLPTATIRPSLMPMSPLTIPQWSMITALVMTRSQCFGLIGSSERALVLPVPDRLAAAEDRLLAVVAVVLFDLDDQLGVGQPDAVALRRAVFLGVSLSREFHAHGWIPVAGSGWEESELPRHLDGLWPYPCSMHRFRLVSRV